MLPPFKRLTPIEDAARLLRKRIDDLIDHSWLVFRDAPWDHQPPAARIQREMSR
jgi:hypothetical protein